MIAHGIEMPALAFRETDMGRLAIIELIPGRLRLRAFYNSTGSAQVSIDSAPQSVWHALKKEATKRRTADPEAWCRESAAKLWGECVRLAEGGAK